MPPPAARMARRGHVPDSSTKQHPGLPPAADKPSVRIRHPVSHAFVGTRGDNAAEYHDNDFVWETLCAAGQEAIRRQQLEASTARPGVDETPPASHDWEEFHAQHSLGRFFKEKRYLPIEFPQLRTPGVTIGEVGCGCGSALIPVLRDNPTATAVACDVSGTAIQVFRDAAMPGAGIDSRRIRLSVNDFPNSSPFEDGSLDMAMIIFTLSAFHPNDMKRVVAAVRRGLKPGGLALVRDYGLYDMAQVRMHVCMYAFTSSPMYSGHYSRFTLTLTLTFTHHVAGTPAAPIPRQPTRRPRPPRLPPPRRHPLPFFRYRCPHRPLRNRRVPHRKGKVLHGVPQKQEKGPRHEPRIRPRGIFSFHATVRERRREKESAQCVRSHPRQSTACTAPPRQPSPPRSSPPAPRPGCASRHPRPAHRTPHRSARNPP